MRPILTVRQGGIVAAVGALALLFLSTIVGQHGLLHLWKLKQDQRALETEVFTLLRSNEELRHRLARLQTDSEFLEKVAREELGLVREGEVIYRFPEASPAPAP